MIKIIAGIIIVLMIAWSAKQEGCYKGYNNHVSNKILNKV